MPDSNPFPTLHTGSIYGNTRSGNPTIADMPFPNQYQLWTNTDTGSLNFWVNKNGVIVSFAGDPLSGGQPWNWNTATTVPPGTSQARTDTGTWITATSLRIDKHDGNNNDQSSAIRSVVAGDELNIQQASNSANWARWSITATPIDQGTYFSVGIVYKTGAGTLPASGTSCTLSLLISGAAAAWYTGIGTPATTLGRQGDMYLDGATGLVWQKQPLGWQVTTTNITGPVGPVGPQGLIADAPNNGTPYSRQSVGWVSALATTGGTMTGDLTVNTNIRAGGNVYSYYLHTTDGSNGVVMADNGNLYLRSAAGGVVMDGGGGLSITTGALNVGTSLTVGTSVTVNAGPLNIIANNPNNISYTGGFGGALMIQGGGPSQGGGAAMITFHRPGSFAAYFGVDYDNQWALGGWSMGAARYVIITDNQTQTLTAKTLSGASLVSTNLTDSCTIGDGVQHAGWMRMNGAAGIYNTTYGIGIQFINGVAPVFYSGTNAGEYLQSHSRADNLMRYTTGGNITMDPASQDAVLFNTGSQIVLPDLNACWGRTLVVKNILGSNASVYVTNGNGIYGGLNWVNPWTLAPGDCITVFACQAYSGWMII